jgi:hypothetical protein
MDVAYGNDSRLRAGITALGVPYVVGIQPNNVSISVQILQAE